MYSQLTPFAGIVHQDNLLEEGARRAINNTPDCSQQGCPGFVMENYHNGSGGQLGGIVLAAATEKGIMLKKPV